MYPDVHIRPVKIYEEDAPSKGSRSKVGERIEVFKWKPKTDKTTRIVRI